MVILRQVVLARRGVSKGHHLCGDRAKAMLGKSGRVIIEALLDERGVVTRSVPDRVKGGTVLRTYIVSLAVTLGGVVGFQGRGDDAVQADHLGVIHHVHHFGVPGTSGAHFAVGGVGCEPAGIAHGRGVHAVELPQHLFGTPEASDTNEHAALPITPWTSDRSAQHGVVFGMFQDWVPPADKGLLFAHHRWLWREQPSHSCPLFRYACVAKMNYSLIMVRRLYTQTKGEAMAVYELPELDYSYDALEPHIAAEIMELHHSKHHQNYVNGANAALEKLQDAREKGNIGTAVTALSKDLAFNLGGHTNHSIFWKNLSPNGGGEPTGALAEAITRDFGSFDKFKEHFNAAALGLQGSGWAVLAYDKIGQRLVIEQMTDQQGNLSIDLVPLLLLDMWEHAFYLQYKNVKADYVNAVWNVFNWDDVAARYAAATS